MIDVVSETVKKKFISIMINPKGINRKKLMPFVLLIKKIDCMSQSEKMNNDRSGQRIEPMYLDFL